MFNHVVNIFLKGQLAIIVYNYFVLSESIQKTNGFFEQQITYLTRKLNYNFTTSKMLLLSFKNIFFAQ